MKRINSILILLLAVFHFHTAVAVIESNTADVFEMKSRLELMVSNKVRKSLETRLNPDDFIVSTNLKLVRDEKPKAEAPPKPALPQTDDSQFLPALPGYVSAETVMTVLEKELSNQSLVQKPGNIASNELSFLKDLKKSLALRCPLV